MFAKASSCVVAVALLATQAAYAGGFVYVHANAVRNTVIPYRKNDDGTLTRMAPVVTGGKGTGQARPLHGNAPGPDPLASAGSLILNRAQDRLFVVNGGDNSVSAFAIGKDGTPRLLDREPGQAGEVPNSLAFHDKTSTLYVGHLKGPGHIGLMKLDGDDLVVRKGTFSIDSDEVKGKLLSHVMLSPDQGTLIANALVEPKPDGTGYQGTEKANLILFRIGADGVPASTPRVADAGGAEPFSSVFLPGGNRFVTLLSETNGVALNELQGDGGVRNISRVLIDDSAVNGRPIEICWAALSPDGRYVYTANFGTGDITSLKVEGEKLTVAHHSVGQIAAKTKFMAAAKVPSSAPLDSWSSKDGFLYQLYAANGQLAAYKMTTDGGLERIGLYEVPVNSVQGLAGLDPAI